MADKRSLGIMGFMFGSVTFTVTLIAFLVVSSHVQGDLQLDEQMVIAPQLVSLH